MSARKIIFCLAVSHVDYTAAKRWLTWASFLAKQKGGGCFGHKLVVFCTHRVAALGMEHVSNAIIPSRGWAQTFYAVCPDENEVGYPMSANHIFLRALEHCRKFFPDHACMFIEPDCVPVSPTWMNDVAEEYSGCGKEFMGDLVDSNTPHTTGNGVYGTDWPNKAPSILGVLDRKSSGGMFPDGRGYPFDLHIGADVLKDHHHSSTIFQIWYPGVWNESNIHRIPPDARLVHQDKHGTLITTLSRMRYNEFFEFLPKPSMYFSLQNPMSDVTVSGRVFTFTPCARTPDGAMWSVYRPIDVDEELILSSVVGKLGVDSINEADYKAMLAQRTGIFLKR